MFSEGLFAGDVVAVRNKKTADVFGDRLYELSRDMFRMGSRSTVVRLGMTIKAHKLEGEVKARGLHCGATNPLKPGSRFVVQNIRSTLSKLIFFVTLVHWLTCSGGHTFQLDTCF